MLELTILICSFIKLLYFLRIFEQFGFLVQMVAKTCKEVLPFMAFFMLWIFFFTISSIILGSDIKDKDDEYPKVNWFLAWLIQIYRNSIGDINTPDYSGLIDEENPGKQYVLIGTIWTFWFLN